MVIRAMKVNRTILFVEDDAVVLTTYRNLLQREGFRIESAQDGLEALKALSQATPRSGRARPDVCPS